MHTDPDRTSPPLADADFARDDETEDRLFYARPRLVPHLDARALDTVASLIGQLVVDDRPRILDLMASWDSHLPPGLDAAQVVGLGLNAEELARNPRLHARVVHDLNREPRLPFADAAFDVVLNTVSVDYLTRPREVFAEVGRVLRPGGLALVVFSNRMFPPKAVHGWRRASEPERVLLVESYLEASGRFAPVRRFVSKGLPRPADDRHAAIATTSDPVYAVWAERRGGDPRRPPRPVPRGPVQGALTLAQLQATRDATARTLCCPHCGQRMRRWRVPQTPFTEWDVEHMYVCFNDACEYLLAGFGALAAQGMPSLSHRQMFEPGRRVFYPAVVHGLQDLRDGIDDDGEGEGEASRGPAIGP